MRTFLKPSSLGFFFKVLYTSACSCVCSNFYLRGKEKRELSKQGLITGAEVTRWPRKLLLRSKGINGEL